LFATPGQYALTPDSPEITELPYLLNNVRLEVTLRAAFKKILSRYCNPLANTVAAIKKMLSRDLSGLQICREQMTSG